MFQLILVRHGQSEWNKKNLFTGWTDVDLSEQGVLEATSAGALIKKNNIPVAYAFTSVLRRAIKTCFLALDEMDRLWVPVEKCWQLNERHYGALQGKNKSEMAMQYGEEQIKIWRRSYKTLPPALDDASEMRASELAHFVNNIGIEPPKVESLELTVNRIIPFFNQVLVPKIKEKKHVLVAAHGNSLRALVKHLQNLTEQEVLELEIPTGKPILINLDQDLNLIDLNYLS
jgi:2,3-bisphosphoglycerate-dependent phosphoglycerate mutase